MKTNIIHNLSYLLLAFFLIGCSNTKNLDVSKSTAKLIYEKAITSANNKQFEDANEAFESILLDYPVFRLGHKVKTYDSLGIL